MVFRKRHGWLLYRGLQAVSADSHSSNKLKIIAIADGYLAPNHVTGCPISCLYMLTCLIFLPWPYEVDTPYYPQIQVSKLTWREFSTAGCGIPPELACVQQSLRLCLHTVLSQNRHVLGLPRWLSG